MTNYSGLTPNPNGVFADSAACAEVLHQADINHTGLASLAAVIATLHLASAGMAGVMVSRAGAPAARRMTSWQRGVASDAGDETGVNDVG